MQFEVPPIHKCTAVSYALRTDEVETAADNWPETSMIVRAITECHNVQYSGAAIGVGRSPCWAVMVAVRGAIVLGLPRSAKS